MLGKTIGLDIIEDTIAAVLVKGGLHGHQVMACASVSISEAGGREAALVSVLEQIDSSGAVCISSIPSDQVSYRNLTLPFKDIRKIEQTIAYELESLLPYPIDDVLVDFTVCSQSAEQTAVLAAAVKKTSLTEYLVFLDRYAVGPEVLDIRNVPDVILLLKQPDIPDNGLFIDLGRERATVLLFLQRRVAMIRKLSFTCRPDTRKKNNTAVDGAEDEPVAVASENIDYQHFCRTIQNSLMAYIEQNDEARRPEKVFITGAASSQPEIAALLGGYLDSEVVCIDFRDASGLQMSAEAAARWEPGLMNGALALALRDSKQGLGFNFRKGAFEPKKHFLKFRKDIRNGVIILGILLVLGMINLGVDYYSLQKRYRELDQEIMMLFKQTFPDITKIVDPVQQARVRVDEMRKIASLSATDGSQPGILDLLADISRRIPATLDVEVGRIVMDPEAVLLKGSTDTFNAVDTIKQGLSQSNYFREVTISSANLDRSGNRVQFEVRLQLARLERLTQFKWLERLNREPSTLTPEK